MSSEGGSGIGTDFLFFVGILAVLFAVWVGSGGPDRPISFAGPFLQPITSTGTTAQPYGDPNAYQPIQGTSWIPSFGAGAPAVTGDYSTLRGKVTISRDTLGAKNSKPAQEYVSIQATYQLTTPVSTSGWTLESLESGVRVSLPQAAPVLRSGNVNTLSAVTLSPGEYMMVVSGRSPVGVSFKENMCTGYLEERQDFVPPLTLACPSASRSYARLEGNEDNACVSYLSMLGTCRTESSYSSDPSRTCEDFIEEHIHYNGCVDLYEDDPAFLSSTWRVFLSSRDELWAQTGETIVLKDASGKIIDALSY